MPRPIATPNALDGLFATISAQRASAFPHPRCCMLSPRSSAFLLACVCTARIAGAQNAPTQQQLDEISARGRALAGYQHAAWTASMQLFATNPDPYRVERYVAYHADSGWVVAFGRLSTERDTFYVSNIAIPAAVNGQRVDTQYEFETFAQPMPDVDFLVRAARAMDVATMTWGLTTRPYSAAAIPDENGNWFVYLTPSADIASVWPLGDDMRYRVSADGQRVLETRRMHAGMVAPGRDGAQLTSRRKALHDMPEDSDVFHMLVNHRSASDVVVTSKYQYLVSPDGSIKLVQGKETMVGAR